MYNKVREVHLKKIPTGHGLNFVAYEILGSTNDVIEDIKRLESWFFEIPPTNRTADPRGSEAMAQGSLLVNYLKIFQLMELS